MSAETKPGREPEALTFVYRNWRGEVAERRVKASSAHFRHGKTEWHPEPQFLLSAVDLDKGKWRDFAANDILHFGPAPAVPAPAGNGVREALEPFAMAADRIERIVPGAKDDAVAPSAVRFGDLRRARDIYKTLATPVSAEEDGLRAEVARLRPHYQSNTATDLARRQMLDHSERFAALTPTPAESAPSGGMVAAVGWAYRESKWGDPERWHLCSDKPSERPGRDVQALYPASTIEALQRERDEARALQANAEEDENHQVGVNHVLKARIAELEASLAQERSKREEAAEDERDRLLAKTLKQMGQEFGSHYGVTSARYRFLQSEGAMRPAERAAARAARGEQT